MYRLDKKIILASASPRRRELLELAGIPFEVRVSDAPELADPSLPPGELTVSIARQKAVSVAAEYPSDTIVLGADTVVVVGHDILGKPVDAGDAVAMLSRLSGGVHSVYTGVCIVRGGRRAEFYQKTDVKFYTLTPSEIAAYVAVGEPMDKAGAYGIQGRGCVLVESISGDYFNVMGLPVARVAREIIKMA